MNTSTLRSFVVAVAVATVGLVTSTPAAYAQSLPACPASVPDPNLPSYAIEIPHVRVGAPSETPYGRKTTVTLGAAYGSDNETNIERMRLEMLDQATGEVFFAHDFTRDQMDALNYLGDDIKFFIQLDRGDGPAVVRVSYGVGLGGDLLPEPAFCQVVIERTVVPTRGVAPRVSMYEDDEGGTIDIKTPSNCERTSVTPVTVSITSEGRRARYTVPDPCVKRMQRRGSVPRLDVSAGVGWVQLWPTKGADFGRRYRVTVAVDGRVAIRRWAFAYYMRFPATRVWEGTDRFVNYCINESKRIWSSGGRLYCTVPSSYARDLAFTKRNPI